MHLSDKERNLLTPFGWSLTCGRDPIVLDSSAVGNDLLYIIEGSVCVWGHTLGGSEQFSTFHAGQLIGRDFFNCGQPSLRIMPGSVCMLLTQESLDHMIREQPKLAAKLYRGFAVALVQHLTGYSAPCAGHEGRDARHEELLPVTKERTLSDSISTSPAIS